MVDCAYSTASTETVSIPNALTGQYYMVMITNYANDAGTITFTQTGGSGTTDCSVLAPPITNNGPLCVGETLQLSVSYPYPGATIQLDRTKRIHFITYESYNFECTTCKCRNIFFSDNNWRISSTAITTTVVVNSASYCTQSATASPSAICIGGSSALTASGGTAGNDADFYWFEELADNLL